MNSDPKICAAPVARTAPADDGLFAVRAFTHPGPVGYPRVAASLVGSSRELRFSVACGAGVGQALRDALEASGCAAGVGRLVSGSASQLHYHVVVPTVGANKPYDYGEPIVVTGDLAFLGATFTFGRMAGGAPVVHCHAGFIDAQGRAHGGHLALDRTLVGEQPLVVYACLFTAGAFVVRRDAETCFNLLQPGLRLDLAGSSS